MPVNTAGISVPPEKPCKMRKVIREAKLPLKAQPIDVNVKTKMAMTNSHRSVRTRVSQPVRGMAMTSAIK